MQGDNNHRVQPHDQSDDVILDERSEEDILKERAEKRRAMIQKFGSLQKSNSEPREKSDLEKLVEEQRNQFCQTLVEPVKKEKVYDLFESSDDDEKAPTKTVNSNEPEGTLDDGYYIPRIGSKVGEYTVTGISGKGVFASVVRAQL